MATTRRGAAQPFKKGRGARTLSAALSAATRGAGATANPQDPDRVLQKNAGGMTSDQQIKLLAQQRHAQQLESAINQRVGGSVPMPGPPKGLAPGSGGNPGGAAAPDPEGGRRVVDNGSAPRTGPKPGKAPGRMSDRIAGPVEKTYLTKGEINQTGNARSGQDYATFTVKGQPGEFHEYVDPKTKKRRVVRVGGVPARSSRTGPAKGARTLGQALGG